MMPAGARVDMLASEHFRLVDDAPGSFTVESKHAQTLTVEFRPTTTGAFNHELQVRCGG